MRKLLKRTPFYPLYKTLGHYPDFLYWKLRGEPPRPPHVAKQRIIKDISHEHCLRILVETGTYYGEMVAAVRKEFEQIFSIESDPQLALKAKKRFRSYPNIHILEGSSQTAIPEVLRSIKEPALFWLDAGYFMWEGCLQNTERFMSELHAIFTHAIKEHVVLVDDVVPFSGRDGTPELHDLELEIKTSFSDRTLFVRTGILCIAHHS